MQWQPGTAQVYAAILKALFNYNARADKRCARVLDKLAQPFERAALCEKIVDQQNVGTGNFLIDSRFIVGLLRDYCASPPYKINGPVVIRPPARQAFFHSPGLDPCGSNADR